MGSTNPLEDGDSENTDIFKAKEVDPDTTEPMGNSPAGLVDLPVELESLADR